MPLDEHNNIKYWGNDEPKCPFCDYEIDISDHEMYELYKEDDHEIDCPDCEEIFTVVSNCKWTFSTNEQEDL